MGRAGGCGDVLQLETPRVWVLPFSWAPQLHPTSTFWSTTTGARLPPPSDPSPQSCWVTTLGMGVGWLALELPGTLTKAFHGLPQDLSVSQGVKARSICDGASRSKLLGQTD